MEFTDQQLGKKVSSMAVLEKQKAGEKRKKSPLVKEQSNSQQVYQMSRTTREKAEEGQPPRHTLMEFHTRA